MLSQSLLQYSQWLKRLCLVLVLSCVPHSVHAQVYNGNGIQSGLGLFAGLGGISSATSLKQLIMIIITYVLDIILFVAVLAVIVAGVYLIVSNGNDENKDKAKKIVFYVIAGIVLILFARIIVMIVNSIFF
jgi:heme/copper-type cytochrome/quinol oxidase subunit 2